MGNACLSVEFVNWHRNSSFLVGPGKEFEGLKNFSMAKDARPSFFLFNFKSRSSKGGGGSAALPAAAAFDGSKKERSVHAAAAMAELRVAVTVFSGTPGALAASAFGCTAIVSVSNGSLASAATDLLDALNSECTLELSGAPTFVSGDNGGCAAAESVLHGTLNSRCVFSSIGIGSIVHAEDHGRVLPVSSETLVALLSAYLLTHQFVVLILIRLTIPSMHVRILVLICVVSGLVLGLVWGFVQVCRVVFFF